MKNNISNKFVFSTITLMAIMILGHASLFAHGVSSQEVETGKIRFSFDDGTPLANGFIKVYDNDGHEIATGQTDAEGTFDFSKYEHVVKVSVTDTHGHHQTHVIGTQGHDHSVDHSHDHHSGNKRLIIIIVVAVLFAVAAVFYLGKKKNGSVSE